MDTRRISARDAAIARLRRLTAGGVAAAGALALAFGFVASKAFPGKTKHVVVRPARSHATTRHIRQTAPQLVAVHAPAPAAPPPASPAPTPTAAPPVVVSGGS